MVTYEDIARKAKVSIATVSHVINNTRFVEPKTKQRVIDVINDLKYKPNLLARSLATGKTSTIGLVISDITNPFYPEIVSGVEDASREKGYSVLLCNINYETKKGLESIGALISKKIDGIIIATSQVADPIIEEIIEYGINYVIVDWGDRDINADKLTFNFDRGIKEAVDYLISMGHRKIFFISGPRDRKSSMVRIKSFVNAISNHKDKDIYYKVLEGDHKLEGGYTSAKEILDEKIIPSAVMCSNDLTAIGAMESFIDSGLKVPADMSVIGLDNIKLTEIIIPHLTTIMLDRYRIGNVLTEMLVKRIEKKDIPLQEVVIDTKLVKRNSVSRIAGS